MRLTFPSVLGIDVEEAENPIQQIVELKHQREGNLVPFTSGRTTGFLFRPGEADEVLILPNAKNVRDGYQRVLIADPDPARQVMIFPRENGANTRCFSWTEPSRIMRSGSPKSSTHGNGAFSFVEEDPARNVIGLRRPQIGAVHAAHMHWIVSDSPATIVMPTGTGKTETMLSILVSMKCQKLLVIVPTDALRTQLAEKFLTLGVLKSPGCAVLKEGAKTPIVCTLQHIPSTPDEVDRIFTRAQVIVTTSHIAGQCEQAVQERMARIVRICSSMRRITQRRRHGALSRSGSATAEFCNSPPRHSARTAGLSTATSFSNIRSNWRSKKAISPRSDLSLWSSSIRNTWTGRLLRKP